MSKRFRVALSFAGEKRAFVAEVATILAQALGPDRVLYDKFHEEAFAVYNLAFHLPKLYHNESDLIVPVVSQAYNSRDWTGLEWNAIYAIIRDKTREPYEVLLTRFDLVEPDGLYGNAGFIELDHKTPAETAALILKRLASNDARAGAQPPPAAAPPLPQWPDTAPPLDWPVADHTEARRAFAQLIVRDAPFRILLIRGNSETGKSHLSKQFLGNAVKIADLAYGRLDFKGSSKLQVESFAQVLGLDPPTKDTISEQLAEMLAALRRKPRPTLLIFDTFELAGKAQDWMWDVLLVALLKAPWIRVVIMGQDVKSADEQPWASISSPLIELRPPSPQEWLDYGLVYKPELTIEFVQSAHKFAEGSSAVLAQLLGPRGRN